MKRLLIASTLAFPLVLGGCLALGGAKPAQAAKAESQPGWVLNPPTGGGRLYGVGSADSYGNDADAASQARDRAKAEIVRQIEVQIYAESESKTNVRVSGGKEQFRREVQELVQSRIPEFQLSHVTTVETWKDEARRTVYVLEALDVEKEIADLRQRVADIEAEVQAIAGSLDQPEYAGLPGTQRLAGVLVRLTERRALRARGNKLRAGTFPGGADPMVKLEDRIVTKMAGLKILLDGAQAEGGKGGELDSGLKRKLTERGLRLVAVGPADIIVSYAVKMDIAQDRGTWYAIPRGDLQIDDNEGNTLRVVEAKAKGASQTEALARSRAIEKLAEALGNELLAVLFPE